MTGSVIQAKPYIGVTSGIGALQVSSNLGGGMSIIGNQTGKSKMNFRKPINVPALAVVDYQVGGGLIDSRHDDASASPVRSNGPANNHEYYELQQKTLRDISADARHIGVRAHLVSSSGVLNAN